MEAKKENKAPITEYVLTEDEKMIMSELSDAVLQAQNTMKNVLGAIIKRRGLSGASWNLEEDWRLTKNG